MTLLDMIYTLFIGPLELFFEVVFSLAYRIIGNPGVSIIVLSLAMNFLVLPLYRQADAMQEAERDRSMAMKPWVDHIKKTFTGDERFMMLQTYYRQNNYKQTDALRGSVSLLLEIPFFIAAYHFLSNLSLLQGVPFGPISDLGAPDALISIGGITINFLPILMTIINVVSAAIYMKGFPLQSKIQMYGIAAIFLILLYGSPAGLVFYWTLNNVFSLVKNIFYKLKNPGFVLSVLASVIGIIGIIFVAFVHPMSTKLLQAAVIFCCLLLQLPLGVHAWRKKHSEPKQSRVSPATKEDDRIFLLCCIFLALLTGVLIPSSVISSSTLEFIDIANVVSPLWYIAKSALIAIGTFIIWFGIFYRLATPKGKRIFCITMWVAVGASIVNYMFFGTNYGNLSSLLQYDLAPALTAVERLLNLGALALVGLVLYAILKKNALIVKIASLSMCLVVVGMSGMNIASISQDLADGQAAIEKASEDIASIPLSKNGQNVVILMMDRATSVYLPAIMHEKPELKSMFEGFTYYPNTLSYGSTTNAGLPGLFGGYEYIPENMDARSDLSLGDKTSEALKVLPVLFNDNGYKVTVCDPSYAGYTWVPDLSIYNDYPEINAYITMNGSFSLKGFESVSGAARSAQSRMRNFFCYSIFKISPLLIQPALYNGGQYNATDVALIQTRDGYSKAVGLPGGFIESFAVLDNLKEITKIEESDKNTFMMMCNDSTHQPVLLEEPSYSVSAEIDNTAFDADNVIRQDGEGGSVFVGDEDKMIHYHVNLASLLKLGEWFDYLKENGVYDNTRIIIVSDHGWVLGQDDSLIFQVDAPANDNIRDVSVFNCMLLVKDFGASQFSSDESFMTNADTPLLATNGLIDNPVNPFTGNALNDSEKRNADHHVMFTQVWDITENNGNEFLPANWFSVKDNVRSGDDWEYLGYY